MKALLVKPYNLSDHIQPSLGLGYLAAAIRKNHDVDILDCIKERLNVGKFIVYLSKHRPDVVGIQCYTFDLNFIKEALSLIRRMDRKIITVLGGPHPTALPNETLEFFNKDLDFLFIGEAETGFSRLLDYLNSGKGDLASIPGLSWREDGRIRTNMRMFIEDLDSLGMPAWDLIHPEKYPESQHGAFFKNFPIAPIIITRGCPYRCTFCAANVVSGRKIRHRGIDNVLGELRYLNKNFGIKEFHIVDDNFTIDKSYAKEFLKRLRALDLGMSWAVPNGIRMDTLDEEILNLMKETGLYLISLGIESGSDKILTKMQKDMTTSKVRDYIKMVRGCGIDIAAFFILGFPGETVETINQTIRFSTELDIIRANFFTYLPLPGSESYNELKRQNKLDGVDWKHFYFMNAVYVPVGLTRKKLRSLQRLAFFKFYLRPRIILYHIKSIKSLRHLYFLARRFLRWIVFN